MNSQADVYVVRVWHATEDAPFRATARAIDQDQPSLFTSGRELAAFLASRPEAVVDAGSPNPGASS